MLRNKIKKLIVGFLYFSGINFVYNKISPTKLFLVGGHSINSKENREILHSELYKDLSIDKGFLEKEIKYLLKNNYKFLTFRKIETLLSGGEKLPQKSVVMYFDDGFRDIYFNAYPVFKKYNLPFTVFITIDFVDQEKLLPRIKERADKLGINISERVFSNWEEIKEMSGLAEIGSHGTTHVDFVDLGETELKKELRLSMAKIQEKIGEKPIALSFPHGKYNQSIKEIVREAGFKFAVTTQRGQADLRDKFELKKVVIYPEDDFILFKLKLGIFYKIVNLLK